MLFTLKKIGLNINGQDILHNQSLSLKPGQHLLLSGPSGCGKSSLMNVISGLLRPSSGDVVFQDQSYSQLNDRQLDHLRAANFGFIFQKLHLIGHLNIVQNIALAQFHKNIDHIHHLIADLGLAGKEKQKARDLSVGEAQRVAIARAVANQPKVIFADEPSSALDDINTQNVMDLIFDQADKNGATIIAATHDDRIKKRFHTISELTS